MRGNKDNKNNVCDRLLVHGGRIRGGGIGGKKSCLPRYTRQPTIGDNT